MTNGKTIFKTSLLYQQRKNKKTPTFCLQVVDKWWKTYSQENMSVSVYPVGMTIKT